MNAPKRKLRPGHYRVRTRPNQTGSTGARPKRAHGRFKASLPSPAPTPIARLRRLVDGPSSPPRVTQRFVIAATAAALYAVVPGCTDQPPPAWHQETGYRWRELEVKGG